MTPDLTWCFPSWVAFWVRHGGRNRDTGELERASPGAGRLGEHRHAGRGSVTKNKVSILTYAIFTVPERERSGTFTRLAKHATAGELTVEYSETGLEALPAIWDNFAARRAGADQDHRQAEGGNPLMTGPARTGVQQETTGPSPGFPAREPSPEALLPTSGNKGPRKPNRS